MRIRYVAIVCLFGFVIWMAFQAPIPGVQVKQVQPDARVPTFQQAVANNAALGQAQQNGQLTEDSRLRDLRRALLDAAGHVNDFPCDAKWRDRLAHAIADFWAYNRKIMDDPPTETMIVDGRTVDARGYLNTEANDAANDAFNAGIAHLRRGVVQVGPGSNTTTPITGSRFVCDGTPS